VLDNLDFIAKNVPQLKYIQIDDGYQPAMGDWLETGAAFGGNVQGVLKQIRARGFEPAIWVAPFVAEENSHSFAQHPDWFVKDDESKPLALIASRLADGVVVPGKASTAVIRGPEAPEHVLAPATRLGLHLFALREFLGPFMVGIFTTRGPRESKLIVAACRPSGAAHQTDSFWLQSPIVASD
jgi:hypothetical protein